MTYHDTPIANLVSTGFDKAQGFDHFLARSASQKDAIFRLRYAAYLQEGIISETDEGVLLDEYDYDGSSSIFGITLNDRLVSTIRLSILSRNQRSSIAYTVCKDYLDPLIARGERIAEGTRLAVRSGDGALRRRIILYTLSLTAAFAASSNADRGAIIVRENHVPFYKRFGFDCARGALAYPGVHKPLAMMTIGLSELDGCLMPDVAAYTPRPSAAQLVEAAPGR